MRPACRTGPCRRSAIALGVGIGALVAGVLLVRYRTHTPFEELGAVRRVLRLARSGLEVLKRPGPAVAALAFQLLGWGFQLAAVWAAFHAFRIDAPISAAALVLVLMNIATIVPLWPGNFGLMQAAVALPLLSTGSRTRTGSRSASGSRQSRRRWASD